MTFNKSFFLFFYTLGKGPGSTYKSSGNLTLSNLTWGQKNKLAKAFLSEKVEKEVQIGSQKLSESLDSLTRKCQLVTLKKRMR